MPIVEKLMSALRKRYGPKEGERVYYAMEAEAKGPFAPGNKYHELHEQWAARMGVQPASRKISKPPVHRRR
jgi:hypothetical protein